ncbi:MAG TPA: hypothetical protein DIU07_19740 [Rhodobacteraceae bacterium]|nr:hypothetical protein [Paracoccaceae bacterium]
MVDRVHLMDAVERFSLFDLLAGADVAAVLHAVHVEHDADALREGGLGIVGRGQRHPPGGLEIREAEQHDGDEGENAVGDSAFFDSGLVHVRSNPWN